MMDDTDPKVAEKLKALQINFCEQLPERLQGLGQILEEFIEFQDMIILKNYYVGIHNLTGVSLTFGADETGKYAHELELFLLKLLDSKALLDAAQCNELRCKFTELERLAVAWDPGGLTLKEKSETIEASQCEDALVYLVEDDELLASRLVDELKAHNYKIEIITNPQWLGKACKKKMPAAIIMDMVFANNDLGGATELRLLLDDCYLLPPVIFISVRDDIEARLAAQRAGAAYYFVKPLNTHRLVQSLNGITNRESNKAYRVLVVDDDKILLEHHCAVLDAQGMEVDGVSDPLKVLDVMNKFKPELVLLDLYMPECSGLELASVIRQIDEWAHMPVVFLSSEIEQEKQLTALELGGDDFLIKPVSNTQLINTLKARLKRARWVAQLGNDLQASLNESESLRTALDKHNIVSIADTKGCITFANDTFCDISGYKNEELIGKNHSILNSGYHSADFFQTLWQTISRGKIWNGEIRNKRKDGSFYWVVSTIIPYLGMDGKPYQYISLRTDITKLVNTQLALTQAKEEAEEANSAKSQFLSSMSHELRTPMNAIIGFGQLLQMETEPPLSTTQLDNVNEILKAGRHLLELINEVLDLAKIEAGRIDLSMEPVFINDVLPECVRLVMPLMQQRRIKLAISHNGTELSIDKCDNFNVVVRADRIRLKQVLLNLLSNAVKYNNEEGTISIECNSKPDGFLRISIRDNGPGINVEKLPELFKPFSRLGAEQTEVEGAGIGLVITQKIIDLMGGTMGVESVKDKGSTFWIELPEKQYVEDQFSDDQLKHLNNISGNFSPGNTLVDNLHKVLYIEDNPANLRLVKQILDKYANVELVCTHDLVLGLALMEEHRPDLILMDINLPGMDGYSVLKKLRQIETTRETPVFAISANAMPQDIKQALDAGFCKYFTKPINVEALLSAIKEVFGVENKLVDKKSRI